MGLHQFVRKEHDARPAAATKLNFGAIELRVHHVIDREEERISLCHCDNGVRRPRLS
jgi:hypothetical protein